MSHPSAGLSTSVFGITINGDAVRIAINGELVQHNRQLIKQHVLELIERGVREFHFDCAQCAYIDSTGLGVLVSIHKRVKDAGGRVVIHDLNDDLTTLFQLTKLDTIFVLETTAPCSSR